MADGPLPAASPFFVAPSGDDASVDDAPAAPDAAEITAAVAAIWSELLKLPRDAIGSDSHFFRLGGYSLLALQIVDRLRTDLGLEVDIALVLGHPVLADFVAALPAADAVGDLEEGEL